MSTGGDNIKYCSSPFVMNSWTIWFGIFWKIKNFIEMRCKVSFSCTVQVFFTSHLQLGLAILPLSNMVAKWNVIWLHQNASSPVVIKWIITGHKVQYYMTLTCSFLLASSLTLLVKSQLLRSQMVIIWPQEHCEELQTIFSMVWKLSVITVGKRGRLIPCHKR